MKFPPFPRLSSLNTVKELNWEDVALRADLPPEPRWFNTRASTSIRVYLVAIPILLTIGIVFSVITNVRESRNPIDINVAFSVMDLVLVCAFNTWGYLSVNRLIPEYMALFVWYYCVWGSIKIVWEVVFYAVLYKGDDDDTKWITLGLVVGLTVIYTLWIVLRAFIPFREWCVECRRRMGREDNEDVAMELEHV